MNRAFLAIASTIVIGWAFGISICLLIIWS